MVDKNKDSDFDSYEFTDDDVGELDENFTETLDEAFTKKPAKNKNFSETEATIKAGLIDRVIDFIKQNFVYVLITVFIIFPSALGLKKMFFTPDAKPLNNKQEEQQPTTPNQNIQIENSKIKILSAPKQEDTLEPPVAQEAVIVQNKALPPVNTITQSPDHDAAQNLLKNINERFTELDKRLEKIGQSMEALALLQNLPKIMESLTEIQKNNAEKSVTKEEVQRIANNLNRLGMVMNQLTRSVFQDNLTATAKERVGSSTTNQGDDFIVHATIPGRAWLRNSKGALLSVKIGDVIPGFGKVEVIDVNTGTVILDSKEKFTEETNH